MKNQVLVTGGAGFIGSELTKQLLQQGAAVTVLDDLSFGRKEHIWKGIRFVRGDLRSPATLKKVIDRTYEQVYHLAAIHFIPYCNEHPDEAVDINIVGTRRLLETLARRRPKRLFFASTAAVYNTGSHPHRIDELPEPMDIYGITKLTGEHLVRQFHIETGVPVAIGRLFNAYGPRETNPHLIPHILNQLKEGKRTLSLGNLKPYRDYIHTSDMAALVRAQVLQTKKGLSLMNVSSSEEYSVRQVVRIFSKLMGQPLRIKSRKALQRKSERQHLLGHLGPTFKITKRRAKVLFDHGLADLLHAEGLLRP